MDVYNDLVWRGLIGDISNPAKIKDFFENKGGVYIGFDPSSSSFHLGNYQVICICRRLSDAGHMVYPLIGGITGLIGDPRDPKLSTSVVLERQLKTKQEISENVDALTAQLKKYAHVQEVINNADFYQNMSVADYLRDIGKLINVNYLLEKDLIARRLETGISYAEFSYTLLQGYDSLYLYRNKNIICQFGGQDQ
jgi:tyrosyl-tRNA synthetase